MFWASVLGGLEVLVHKEIWLGIVLFGAAQFCFLLAASTIFTSGASKGRVTAGCLITALGPLFQAVMMSIFVGFYIPIMLGSNEGMGNGLVLSAFWPLAKVGFIALITLGILCIIPGLGGLVADSPGIQNFLLGAIIFRLMIGPAIAGASAQFGISDSLFPDFWSSLGYLIIAGALVRVIPFGWAFISTINKTRTASETEGSTHNSLEGILIALGPIFGALSGLLPLFMYAQHVRLALRVATGN